MPKLAKEAAISVGSLYQYYPNKQALLKSLYDDYLQGLRDIVINFHSRVDDYPEWREGIKTLLSELLAAEQNSGSLPELNQAVQLYPELEEIDRLHSDKVSLQILKILKHYRFPGSKAQLLQLTQFSYCINIGSWAFRSRFNNPKQLKQCNHWELVANLAIFEDYLDQHENKK